MFAFQQPLKPASLTSKPVAKHQFKFVSAYYLVALLLLLVLAAFNYFVIQRQLVAQEKAAATINEVGRQRMLSQRVALLALQLMNSDTFRGSNDLRNQLTDVIGEMATRHERLVHKSSSHDPELMTSTELNTIYYDSPFMLDSQVHSYLELAREIALIPEASLRSDHPYLITLLTDAPILLDGIETVTTAYQTAHENDIHQIEQVEFAIFCLTLAVLILETGLIFRPMYRRIQREAQRLAFEITVRKAAEIELQESKARYQAVVDSQTEAVCRYRADGTLTFVNDAYCNLTNMSREGLLGSNMFDLLPELVATKVRSIIESGRTVLHEHEGISSTGEPSWQEWVEGPILDAEGHVIEYQAVGRDRTELKHIETALQESENRYRLLVRNLPNLAVLMFDRDMRFTVADGPFHERAGYNRDAMIGKTLSEVIPSPEIRESLLPLYEAVLSGEEAEVERDRGDFVYHSRFVPVRDESGNVVGGMAVTEDITQRFRAEQARRESEELFRQLVSNLRNRIFWMMTTDGSQLLYVSPSVEEIWGVPAEQFSQDFASFAQFIHPDDRERVLRERKESLGKENAGTEYRIIRPDGSIRWIYTRIFPVQDGNGNTYCIAGVMEDNTKRKAAEISLQESEGRFRQLAENVRSVFWLIEANSNELVYISPAYETIWGRSCMSMYANPRSFIEAIHPEDRDRVIQERQEKLLSGTYNVEYRILRPDNSVRWVSSRAYPIYNEAGQIYRIAGVSDDITDRKEFERQSLELTLEREQIRLLADFIRDTSHDLRTPLTVINNNLYLLKRSGDYQKHTERFTMMENQVMHINRLLADLHVMSELDTAAVRPELRDVSVNDLVESILREFDEQAVAKSHRVVFTVDPQLPILRADSFHLGRSISNLVHNAILFTPEGGTITLDTAFEGSEIIVSVQDTGIGIEAEHLARIFDRFYKVDSSRTSGNGGHGLGLTMVKKIMEMHHGRVEVESIPGHGSIFRLFLPLRDLLT